jgi:hypothetical protein
MRESLERRYEAEHYLGREGRAGALIERLVGLPGDVTEEAFLSELERLPYADLRAFPNRVAELTGGQADRNADAGPLRPSGRPSGARARSPPRLTARAWAATLTS